MMSPDKMIAYEIIARKMEGPPMYDVNAPKNPASNYLLGKPYGAKIGRDMSLMQEEGLRKVQDKYNLNKGMGLNLSNAYLKN